MSGTGTGDLDVIRGVLHDRLEDLAHHLLGPPNRHTLRRHEWRWGTHDSRSLVVRGSKRGSYMNHEAGVGGGALDMIADAHGCSIGDAIRFAENWAGTDTAPFRPAPRSVRDPEAEARREQQRREEEAGQARKIADALRIWAEALPVMHAGSGVLRAYLAWRGIRRADIARHFDDAEGFFHNIRYHPECPRNRGELLPAMVGLAQDVHTGQPCGIQRTYLAPNGLGKVQNGDQKLAKGRIGGAAIRLQRPGDDVTTGLGLAEGIETGLSCIAGGWTPIWVTCGCGPMANFPVLPGVEALTLYADNGPAGLRAAHRCAERWQEPPEEPAETWNAVDAWLGVAVPPQPAHSPVEVRIVAPLEGEGDDWNDVLRRRAAV